MRTCTLLVSASLAWLPVLCASTSLTVQPELATGCNADHLARVTLYWTTDAIGPVQIRVGGPAGPPMTSAWPGNGSAQTGDWVTDGMVFVLVDASGGVLAEATAQVACQPPMDSAWFPLQVGNTWIYRFNSRAVTASHVTQQIIRAARINGVVWFVFGVPPDEQFFRTDPQGRVYRMAGGQEQLILDPAAARRTAYSGPIGSFDEALTYDRYDNLISSHETYVRGAGLVSGVSDMLTGSSGGLTDRRDLVYARIGGHTYYQAPPASAISLGADSTDLDVTGGHAFNCAVPCYFVACGLVPGADPPGTYKPCFEARVRAASPVHLELLDPSGVAVFAADLPAAGDSPTYRQVPLYATPNTPFPPGVYRLHAITAEAEAGLNLHLQ